MSETFIGLFLVINQAGRNLISSPVTIASLTLIKVRVDDSPAIEILC